MSWLMQNSNISVMTIVTSTRELAWLSNTNGTTGKKHSSQSASRPTDMAAMDYDTQHTHLVNAKINYTWT